MDQKHRTTFHLALVQGLFCHLPALLQSQLHFLLPNPRAAYISDAVFQCEIELNQTMQEHVLIRMHKTGESFQLEPNAISRIDALTAVP